MTPTLTRIKFRRIFLHLGVLGFSYTTFQTVASTENYSSKQEIQKILDFVGTNLTWPDEGSALDDVFKLYNQTQQRKSYVMIAASFLFWSSLVLDTISYWTSKKNLKDICVVSSRVVNFLGSLLVFASVILVGLPDYLEASHLDEICPYCGKDFNRTVKYVAEFSIGLFFACLFTFQLLPVLMTIAPALVRASVYSILLFVYYMYNCVYVGLVMALLLYSFQLYQFLEILRNLIQSPTVWFGTMAQVFLCNVVISDLLYMTVF